MKNIAQRARFYFKKTDIKLWVLILAAIVYSLLLITSMQRSGDYNYFRTQLLAAAIGFTAAVVLSNADYNYIIKKWYISAITAVLMALLVFLFGIRVSGTDDTAWINLFGFTVQPSELIKICFIITLTKHISELKEREVLNKPWAALSLFAHTALPIAVIHVQGDDGAALIFGIIFLTMTFIAGVKLRYYAALGAVTAAAVPVIWNFILNDEHRNRLLALIFPDGSTVTGYGWQQYQGKLSVASGGLFGTGLFNGSRVQSAIVPEQENDFILTVAGEELGFAGCMFVLIILLMIILRILKAAKTATDFRGTLICSGVFALIASQTVINLGMVLGFFPVIGVTLPLFSSGGSSVISVLICVGLVQSVYGIK